MNVHKEIFIQAEPERVFEFLTRGELITGWGGREAEVNPEPGGIYKVSMGEGMTLRGEFVQVDPPHRLIYTWGWEGSPLVPPGSTRVEIQLRPEDGGTRLILTHMLLPEDARENTEEGWNHYLQRLRRLIVGGDAGPDEPRLS